MHEAGASPLDLRELTDLVHLHSGAQGLDRVWVDEVLRRIEYADGSTAEAWAPVWTREATAAQASGDWALALKLYNLARFPFINEPSRREAHELCLRACLELTGPRYARSPVARIELRVRGHSVPFYLRRSLKARAPLLLVFGGIVSNKEQWLGFLDLTDKLGMDVAIAEFPGVGENRLPLNAYSHEMVKYIIDAVQGPQVQECFIIALSFGGTLALRQAAQDTRIRGIATVGAPIRSFYEDVDWWNRIPSTTRVTLQYILGVPEVDVFEQLASLALTTRELSNVRIPVHYVQCMHDEIIQSVDATQLAAITGPLQRLNVNDVHGAPNHLKAVRLFITAAVLQAMQPRSPQAGVFRICTSLLGCLPAFQLSMNPKPSV